MLKLTSKKNEKIRITMPDGQVIEITVLKTSDQQTQLGFEANRSVKINRVPG